MQLLHNLFIVCGGKLSSVIGVTPTHVKGGVPNCSSEAFCSTRCQSVTRLLGPNLPNFQHLLACESCPIAAWLELLERRGGTETAGRTDVSPKLLMMTAG